MTMKGGVKRPQKKGALRHWAASQYQNRETWVRLVRRKRRARVELKSEPGLPEWPGLDLTRR